MTSEGRGDHNLTASVLGTGALQPAALYAPARSDALQPIMAPPRGLENNLIGTLRSADR